MANVVIVKNDSGSCATCADALEGTGHAVKIIGSDREAMDYLVRQRKAPDVAILDMRWPGSAEILVMGAIQRLSHLAHTRVVAIAQERGGSMRASQSWGADVILSTPISSSEVIRAIHTLTPQPVTAVPTARDIPEPDTRVWWEGAEAIFLRWTDESLMVAWPDATDTAVKIPRGAVIRLLHKGVLQIEGNAPAWVRLSGPEYSRLEPISTLAHTEAAPAAVSERDEVKADSADLSRNAVMASSVTKPDRLDKPADKLSVVARLIRKLTGGGAPQQPREASQVVQGS